MYNKVKYISLALFFVLRKEGEILVSKYIDINQFLADDYATTFIVGARGVGKTVNALVYAIKKAYDENKKFIYLRRYQTEIDTLGLNLPLLSKLTGHKIVMEQVPDDSGRTSLMLTADKKPVGYLLALSVASKYKSTDYTGCFLIIYDEFIDIRGRELKNEVNLFLNFAMTVFRDFSKYKSLFLANATDLFNCYFIAFNLIPRGKITKDKKLSVKVVMYKTSEELEKRNKTPLARLVYALDSDDPSLSNDFHISENYIDKQEPNAKCIYIMRVNGTDYGLWKGNYYTLSKKYDPGAPKVSLDALAPDYDFRPYYTQSIAAMLISHSLSFSDLMTRGVWLKFLKEKRLI